MHNNATQVSFLTQTSFVAKYADLRTTTAYRQPYILVQFWVKFKRYIHT